MLTYSITAITSANCIVAFRAIRCDRFKVYQQASATSRRPGIAAHAVLHADGAVLLRRHAADDSE